MPGPSVTPAARDRRAIPVLMVAVGTASMSMYASWPIASIAAVRLSGDAWLAGVPGALGICGTSVGALVLGRLMARHGRRAGLRVGWGIGLAGAVVAIVAAATGSLAGLLVAMFGIGWGNAASVMARYAAGELASPQRRAAAIGAVVWAATFAAIAGPTLASAAGHAVYSTTSLPAATGAFVVAAAALVAALALTLALPASPRGDDERAHAAQGQGNRATHDEPAHAPRSEPRRRPVRTRIALISLLTCQAGMVMPMSVTPVHLDHHHASSGVVGAVMSSHFAGMFALAPLIGMLVDAAGAFAVMLGGVATLGAAGLLAATMAPGMDLSLPLLLLGVGWSGSFVAASSTIAASAPSGPGASARQGRIDAAVWATAAVASLGSGFVVQATSYATLGRATAGAAAMAIVVMAALHTLDARRPGRPPAQPERVDPG